MMASSSIRLISNHELNLRSLGRVLTTATATTTHLWQVFRGKNVPKMENFSIKILRQLSPNLLDYLRHFEREDAIDEWICGGVECGQTLNKRRDGHVSLTLRDLLVHLQQVKDNIRRPTTDENF